MILRSALPVIGLFFYLSGIALGQKGNEASQLNSLACSFSDGQFYSYKAVKSVVNSQPQPLEALEEILNNTQKEGCWNTAVTLLGFVSVGQNLEGATSLVNRLINFLEGPQPFKESSSQDPDLQPNSGKEVILQPENYEPKENVIYALAYLMRQKDMSPELKMRVKLYLQKGKEPSFWTHRVRWARESYFKGGVRDRQLASKARAAEKIEEQ